MALEKTVRDTISKLPLSYHRIFQVIEEVNFETGVYIKSYLSAEERELEKSNENDVFSETLYVTIEGHDGPITVEDAYSWLKENCPRFEGAKDV